MDSWVRYESDLVAQGDVKKSSVPERQACGCSKKGRKGKFSRTGTTATSFLGPERDDTVQRAKANDTHLKEPSTSHKDLN